MGVLNNLEKWAWALIWANQSQQAQILDFHFLFFLFFLFSPSFFSLAQPISSLIFSLAGLTFQPCHVSINSSSSFLLLRNSFFFLSFSDSSFLPQTSPWWLLELHGVGALRR
jgi:hypothetical protein